MSPVEIRISQPKGEHAMKPQIPEAQIFHAWLTKTGEVTPELAKRLWHKAHDQFDLYITVTQFLTGTEYSQWSAFREQAKEYFGERFVADPRIQEQGMEQAQPEEVIRESRHYWYVE